MSQPSAGHTPRGLLLLVAVAAMAAAIVLPGGAAADQASQPASPEAGRIATGDYHSCAIVSGAVRCWGYGGDGALGYGNTESIGDDDAPEAAGQVNLGAGRTADAIAAGSVHTCALLDNGTVRCWGFGGNGRLGYRSTNTIGDDETPASLPSAVNLGAAVKAIAAGSGHTCAILEDNSVRCWGFNLDGRLGLGHVDSIGDDEFPSAGGTVNLGPGRTARAITAGGSHTCALLDNGGVRCWGFGGNGRLGYGKVADIGRTLDATPETVGPVALGRPATAITAGFGHTCAILDDASVRCWGFAGSGRLGYGNLTAVGDDEQPGMVAPLDLGAGRTARAIHAGIEHTCAVLDNGSVRCWGAGGFGQLGYGNLRAVGDNETPGSLPAPVDLGAGRTATAVSAGFQHSCARLDDGSVRCWGRGSNGRLGYCNEVSIGDDEPPGVAGPVQLGQPGIAGAGCPFVPTPPPAPPPAADIAVPPAAPPAPAPPLEDALAAALAAERARAALMSACMRPVRARRTADRRRARALVGARRRLALRLANTRYAKARTACVTRHGRVPGRVTKLKAVPTGAGKVRLSFQVAGSNGFRAPAARSYLIKQSTRPIRTARDFARAAVLCGGKCEFPELTSVFATVTLDIIKLDRNRTYYYAVAARDNVSSRVGPRSRTASVRAR